MRMFDIRDSWLDLAGNPLIGRVKFCKLHTTVLENIYDYQGTPLSNPVFTNTIGQLSKQVFLQDQTDYTVIFEKYIGNGDFTDDPDVDNWSFQYSCDNLWDVYGIEVEAQAIQTVNTVEDLRSTDPVLVDERDGRRIVILAGYNNIADKPPVMYIWDENSIDNDNGGSIIKENGIPTGRWVLVNTFGNCGIDVRHFGVFGVDSAQDASDNMSLQISMANNYATSIGLPLYFPCIDGLTWYKMNNLNISGAIFAGDTRVFGNTGTSSVITVPDADNYLSVFSNSSFGATFTVTGPIVKTSWGQYSNKVIFSPSYKLIIDSDVITTNKSFSNIIVDYQIGSLTYATFNGCIINAVKKLGDHLTFRNCRLTESMFSDDTDMATITVYDDDAIELADWPTTSKWLILRQQNSIGPLDFEGRTLDSTCEVNWTGVGDVIDYMNAVFDGFVVKQPNFTMKNCKGTADLSVAATNMNLDNCQIVFTPAGSTISGTFYCNMSTISFGKNMTFGNFYSDFSTINDSTFTYYASDIIIDFSNLNVALSTSGHVDIQNSNINKNIVTGTTNFLFKNDIFNAQQEIPVIIADTVISGTWIRNVGNVANPIYFNISGSGTLAADENLHVYQYIDNTGTFAPLAATSVIYKTGSNIMNTHSGSYMNVDYGKIQFYIKNNKDIIIAQPYVESKNLSLFHIGSNVNYKMTMEFIINYSTFSGTTMPMSFTQIKEYTGNIPNDNWINGYVWMPIIGRLDNNDPTVVDCKIYLKVEKV